MQGPDPHHEQFKSSLKGIHISKVHRNNVRDDTDKVSVS